MTDPTKSRKRSAGKPAQAPRIRAFELLRQGLSVADVARVVERHPMTVRKWQVQARAAARAVAEAAR
jgi:transposase